MMDALPVVPYMTAKAGMVGAVWMPLVSRKLRFGLPKKVEERRCRKHFKDSFECAKTNRQEKDERGPIRVVVHEDVAWEQRDFTRHLSLANGFILIETKGEIDKVLDECRRAAPCVLITDLALLSETNLTRFGETIEYGELVQVVVMSPEEDYAVVERLLSAGCKGFLAVDALPGLLKTALRAVASGEIWASRKAVSSVFRNSLVRANCTKLSKRETEILQLIGEGLTNRAIAKWLFISRETVRWHIRSLYSKIGSRDRLHAAIYAKRFLVGDQRIGAVAAHNDPQKSTASRAVSACVSGV